MSAGKIDQCESYCALGRRLISGDCRIGKVDAYRVTVNVADWVTPLVAEIVTIELFLLDTFVDTVKVALVCPAGTNTLDGTVAIVVLLLDNVTDVPVDGAGQS